VRKNPLRATVRDLLAAAETLYFVQPPARGHLARAGARVKALLALALIVIISVTTSPAALSVVTALLIATAAASGVGMRKFLARVFLVAPLFTAIITLPALFSGITPGEEALRVGPWIVTREGLRLAAMLTLRVSAALCALQLLVMTTPWHTLIRAFDAPGLPRTFTLLLLLTYRYIHVMITGALERMHGVTSRMGSAASPAMMRKVMAANMLSLFLTSRRVSDEVYDAMRSRGWRTL
jgi:cobalt/nickel transport system permease protein